MKWLVSLFSFLTFAWMLNDFSHSESSINAQSIEQKLPAVISFEQEQTQLTLEQTWATLKQQHIDKINAAKKPEVKAEENKASGKFLTIGDKQYQLLGVFASSNEPFVLLKAKSQVLKKLIIGQELTDNIILTQITNSKITVKQGERTIDYKLFELSKNNEN